ncbi:MAG: hypothetical protein R2849_15970 [Thermomicrobiales bacterium]
MAGFELVGFGLAVEKILELPDRPRRYRTVRGAESAGARSRRVSGRADYADRDMGISRPAISVAWPRTSRSGVFDGGEA